MSEYIHSGVAGKMNRIVKPHIGKVLVTDKFGNAKESDVTIENLRAELEEDTKIGNLNNLNTTNKANLVSAINEVQAGLGGSGSDWEWDSTPIYEETLSTAFYYDDEETNAYTIPIPAAIIGEGLKAVRVVVEVGQGGSNEPCDFQINGGGYSGGPIFGAKTQASGIWEFLAIPEHGCLVGIVALKQDLINNIVAWGDVNPGIPSTIKIGIIRNVDGAQILIHSMHIIHKSLPVGTNIKVYVPHS